MSGKTQGRHDGPSGEDAVRRDWCTDRPVIRRCWHLAAGVVVAVLFVALCVLSRRPVTWPADHFSDMNVLMSGENFAAQGFFRLHFLPVHFVGPVSGEAGPYTYYTHYPPLPNVANGLMRAAGIDGVAGMRVLCGGLFLIGLGAMVLAFSPLIGPAAACAGLAVLGATAYWLSCGMSLHQHTWNCFFLGLFFLSFLSLMRPAPRTRGLAPACGCVLLLGSLASFEFILYPQIFAWVYVLATRQLRARWPLLAALATAPWASDGRPCRWCRPSSPGRASVCSGGRPAPLCCSARWV